MAAFANLQILHQRIQVLKMQPCKVEQGMDSDDLSLLFALMTKCVIGIKTDVRIFVGTECFFHVNGSNVLQEMN